MATFWPDPVGINLRDLELDHNIYHDRNKSTSLQASQTISSDGTQSGDYSWPNVPASAVTFTQTALAGQHLEMSAFDVDMSAHGDFQFNSAVEISVENSDSWCFQGDEGHWKTTHLTPIVGLSSQQTLSPFIYPSLEQITNEVSQSSNEDLVPMTDPPPAKTQACHAAGLLQTLNGHPSRSRRTRRSRITPSGKSPSRSMTSPMLSSRRPLSLQKVGSPLSNLRRGKKGKGTESSPPTTFSFECTNHRGSANTPTALLREAIASVQEAVKPFSAFSRRKATHLVNEVAKLADQLDQLAHEEEKYGNISSDDDEDTRPSTASSSQDSLSNSELANIESETENTSVSSSSLQPVVESQRSVSVEDGQHEPVHPPCLQCGIKDLYYCTREGCKYSTHSFAEWKRHEKSQKHSQQERFMCLECPQSPPPADGNGNPVCEFCRASLPILGTNLTAHYLQCQSAQQSSTTYGRKDRLIAHLRSHPGVVNVSQIAAAGKYTVNSKWPRQCGFCGVIFKTWDERMDHIGGHFQDGIDMSSWKLPFRRPKSFLPGLKPQPKDGDDSGDDMDGNDNNPGRHMKRIQQESISANSVQRETSEYNRGHGASYQGSHRYRHRITQAALKNNKRLSRETGFDSGSPYAGSDSLHPSTSPETRRRRHSHTNGASQKQSKPGGHRRRYNLEEPRAHLPELHYAAYGVSPKSYVVPIPAVIPASGLVAAACHAGKIDAEADSFGTAVRFMPQSVERGIVERVRPIILYGSKTGTALERDLNEFEDPTVNRRNPADSEADLHLHSPPSDIKVRSAIRCQSSKCPLGSLQIPTIQTTEPHGEHGTPQTCRVSHSSRQLAAIHVPRPGSKCMMGLLRQLVDGLLATHKAWEAFQRRDNKSDLPRGLLVHYNKACAASNSFEIAWIDTNQFEKLVGACLSESSTSRFDLYQYAITRSAISADITSRGSFEVCARSRWRPAIISPKESSPSLSPMSRVNPVLEASSSTTFCVKGVAQKDLELKPIRLERAPSSVDLNLRQERDQCKPDDGECDDPSQDRVECEFDLPSVEHLAPSDFKILVQETPSTIDSWKLQNSRQMGATRLPNNKLENVAVPKTAFCYASSTSASESVRYTAPSWHNSSLGDFLQTENTNYSLASPGWDREIYPLGLQNYSIPPHNHRSSFDYPQETESVRNTPSSLRWTPGTDFVKLYKFIVPKDKSPGFELQEKWTPTFGTQLKVYPDEPTGCKKNQVPCQYPGCNGKVRNFDRPPDLESHYKNANDSENGSFFCDYSKCPCSQDSSFSRKDHFRDRLRGFRKEDIACAEAEKSSRDMGHQKRQKGQRRWLSERNIGYKYWRCARCLVKNYLSQGGRECPSCKSPCKEDHITSRKKLSENGDDMKIREVITVLELAPGYPQEADPNTIYTWLNSVYGETFEFVPKGPDKEDDKSSMQQAGQPAKQEDKLILGEEDEQKQVRLLVPSLIFLFFKLQFTAIVSFY